jgi:hypothetical protein
MKRLLLLAIPLSLFALSACVVVPAHGYYRYGAVVAVPPPVVSVHAAVW